MRKLKRTLMSLGASLSLVLIALLAAAAPAVYAQSDRGTIQGIVTDQSGGVVPDAKVEIRHLATGTVTSLSTNREGLYTAPNLPVGEYLVLITKDGFAPATGDGVNLRAGVQIRVNLVLNP